MPSLHDEGHCVRLEDIYVPIKTVTYKKISSGEETKKLKHYTEMFLTVGFNNSFLLGFVSKEKKVALML